MSERHDVRRKVVAVSEPLTSERLAELRRIAEAATPGPWEWDKYLHLFSATGKPVLTKPFSPDNPDVVEARPEDLDYIERFNPVTALALLDRIEALEQERDAARGADSMTDMTVIVHPTQSGHVRIVVSSDGPAETLMTPDEARELARRLLWAVRLSEAARMRGLDDEVGVGLTDPGGDEA